MSDILFIFPGVEGNCEVLKDLSLQLENANIQVYGLEYTRDVPNDSIQSSATLYLDKIKNEMSKLNKSSCLIAGYSYGGMIAIELLRQFETNRSNFDFDIPHLVLLDTSHKFFQVGVHAKAHSFGIIIPCKDIFGRSYIYTGSLSIYLSIIIGRQHERFHIYDHIRNRSANLDDALDKAFEFVQQFHEFEDKLELKDIREYLKYILLKSNPGFTYNFDTNYKLSTPISLFKANKFMYERVLNELKFRKDYDSKEELKLEFDSSDYGLHEIALNYSVHSFQKGNHWSMINENLFEITNAIVQISNSTKSKL